MNTRQLSVVYCEDIRNEIGGKHSLMGVYNTDIVFQSMPAVMPKLCAILTLYFHPDDAPKKSLVVKILKDEELLGEAIFDEVALSNPRPTHPSLTEPRTVDTRLVVHLNMQFPQILFETPCKIRPRAIFDGEELKGNGLRIRIPVDGENIEFFPMRMIGTPPSEQAEDKSS